jgi:hypothetical protein
MKSIVVTPIVNKAAINAGLQGITIAPKKNPKTKALRKGLLRIGALTFFGIILLKSKSRIRKMLMIDRIPNAIGEITPITFVNEA